MHKLMTDLPSPGLVARQVENGIWQTLNKSVPAGRYVYNFLLNGNRWLNDPANPLKAQDGFGSLNSVLVVEAGEPG